ncbi:MAG: TolC family protein [candidate division KSB1 bacterium]|nr:TolC family protein [candidate division KSB1 bacterium]MDZ7403028.1 TolC family protein [candidate division KSB1 bacterium]
MAQHQAVAPANSHENGATLRLHDLLHEARARNPEIRAAQKRWQAMQARIKPAGTLEDPQIGLQVMYVPYPLRNAFNNERALTISQMFEFPGKLGLMSGMARREAEASGAEYERVVLRVLTEVKKIYFMLFHLDYELANNRENRALMRQFIEIANVKYATGMGLQPDIIKAQTEYSMMFNDSLMLAQERSSMAAMLNALLDRPADSQVPVIHEHFDPRHFSFSLDSLVQSAYANRPELKSMQAMTDMYQLSGRLARREYFPDLMLSYTHRQMPAMQSWDAMISFNVPLYFWRKEKLRVQEAEANYQMADASLQSMRNMVRAEVESAFYKVEQAARSVRIFQNTIVPQAEQSLMASRAAYENNKVDFLMLLDSQRTLRDLKLAAHRALADFGTRLAELELAVGTQLVNLD